RQERDQVLARRQWADTGSTTAVRDAERLVQVQVRDVTAETAGPGVSEQRVEVRAVDVDLPAGRVHRLADLAHLVLVDTVRGRVGEHHAGEVIGVLGDARPKIGQIDVAVRVGPDDDHAHPRQDGRGGVGPVGGRGDQADVTVALTTRGVVPRDREQAGELALAPG